MPSPTVTDPDAYRARVFAVARWNALWEAAQFRRRLFHDDTDDDADDSLKLPADLARIADLGDNNIVFVPRTQTCYYDYAPLFHLLHRATLERFGLPLLHGGQWPFGAELTSPDPYLPADFSGRLSKAWGATVWRHLVPGSPQIAFTKDDPIRILAHNLDFWIPAVTEAMEDEMRTWPIVETDYPSGPVRLSNGEILEGVTAGSPRVGSDLWTGEDEAAEFVVRTIEAADRTGRLRDILDAVRCHRVHDDFSDRWSYAKEDFERTLNHKRSKVTVTFVELDDTTPVYGPETEVIGQLACSDFLTLLNPRDREVVVLLRSGVTSLTDVGKILGYSSHSAVSKRLARIRDQAARFFDQS
nr:sigma-70 family RNA polymerase sigma factor [Mycolicibacterium sphagni]